jgi:hypothetical protein
MWLAAGIWVIAGALGAFAIDELGVEVECDGTRLLGFPPGDGLWAIEKAAVRHNRPFSVVIECRRERKGLPSVSVESERIKSVAQPNGQHLAEVTVLCTRNTFYIWNGGNPAFAVPIQDVDEGNVRNVICFSGTVSSMKDELCLIRSWSVAGTGGHRQTSVLLRDEKVGHE